jgi:hypothetical protein
MNTQMQRHIGGLNRSGSAIVTILIIAVIVAIAYAVGKPLFFPPRPPSENPSSSHEVFPWEKEDRLLQKGVERQFTVSKKQPSIEDGLFLQCSVKQTGKVGDLTIDISPDGLVEGGWSADYYKSKGKVQMNFIVNGTFKGNIDPSNVFFDENGEDPSKLFFICKGQVGIVALELSGKTGGMVGQKMYVTGWINPDNTAKGELYLLPDRKTHKIYNWKTVYRPDKSKRNALEGLVN